MLHTLIMLAVVSAPPDYDKLVDVAVRDCRVAVKGADKKVLRAMLQAEIDNGWPSRLRGAVLAAACHESGYSHSAEGDCLVKRGRKVCRAVGVLQLWPWAKIDRTDPVASAKLWTGTIARAVPKAKRKGCKKPWITAWNWVASGPKNYRCDRVPNHVPVLRRFRWAWKRK